MKNPTCRLAFPCIAILLAVGASASHAGTGSNAAPALAEILRAFSGQWQLDVRFEPASGFPPGTAGKGEESWRAAVDGKAALTEESWSAGKIGFSVLGIIWRDAKSGTLHAMDCNSKAPGVCDPKDAIDSVVVRWTGSELVVDEPERGPDGKLSTSRITWSDIKQDSFTETGSFETFSGKFETMMTIRATRAPPK